MTKPNNDEGKEFELEQPTTLSQRLTRESLVDVWQFVKSQILTHNPSFNQEVFNTISNEVHQINRERIQSKHRRIDSNNPHNYPFDPQEINNESNTETTKNKKTQQMNKEMSYENDNKNYNELDNNNDDARHHAPEDIPYIEDMKYAHMACPLTLIPIFMSNNVPNLKTFLVYQKLKSINLEEQCVYLRGTQISSAITALEKIQKQSGLTSEEIDPLRQTLQQYYNIILYPQNIIQCTFNVFVATIISASINVQNINVNTCQDLYFLFSFVQEFDNLQCDLLSFTRLTLASLLSQKVAEKYHQFDINVQTLERVLKRWIKQGIAFYPSEVMKRSIKKAKIWIKSNITEKLMLKEYVLEYFEAAGDLFHNTRYTIKMQQIDYTYKTFMFECLGLPLTIFSSPIMCEDERMYNVVTQIEDKLQMIDLLSAKELKILYGIRQNCLPISLMDLIQQREDKLLYGYLRSLNKTVAGSSTFNEIFDLCREFVVISYSYNHKPCFSTTEIPIQINTEQHKSKKDMTILQEEIYERIQNAIDSNDNKYKCIPVILLDIDKNNGVGTYYRDHILPVNISNDNFVGFFHRNNKFCTDWICIQQQAKLYDISFNRNQCKAWKNNIRYLTIKPPLQGIVKKYDYNKKFGYILCNGVEYRFTREQFLIDNDSKIYWGTEKGMPVYFHKYKTKKNKKRAINIRPVNEKYYK